MNLKRAFEIGGRATIMLRHALCVFPVLPSLMRNENPLVVPPLLEKKTFAAVGFGGREREEED